MAETAEVIETDDEIRNRNQDLNTIGKGALWGLFSLVTPVYLFFISRRIFPRTTPWAMAIGGTILSFIPLVNLAFGIFLIVYIVKRIGGRFFVGQLLPLILLVFLAIAAAVMIPAVMHVSQNASVVEENAATPLSEMVGEPSDMPVEESIASGSFVEDEDPEEAAPDMDEDEEEEE